MRKQPRRRLVFQAIALVFVSLAAPASAFASSDPGGGFFFDAFASFGRVEDYSLHVAALVTEPDPLKERSLRIDGGGHFFGGGIHGVMYGKEARGGFGFGVFGVDGLKLRYDSLPPQLSADIEQVWGISIDAFVGRELVKGPVYPYVDLRAAFSIIDAGVVLHHPEYGVLGETPYNAYSFGIGPRLGVSIPLSDPWAIDISGYYGLFGAEQATIVASIGVRDR